jgi:hypothetical protein
MPDNGDLMQMGEGLPSLTPSGVDVDMHFRDFASFLDGVGLCVEWSPIFNNVERPEDFGNLGLTEGTDQPAPAEADVRARAGSPFSTWLPSAPTKDRNSSNVCDLASKFCRSSNNAKITHKSKILVSLIPRFVVST